MATSSPIVGGGTNDLQGGFNLPVKILEKDLMSETSQAHMCFVQQKFSAMLQAYMVDYVISINGPNAVYA